MSSSRRGKAGNRSGVRKSEFGKKLRRETTEPWKAGDGRSVFKTDENLVDEQVAALRNMWGLADKEFSVGEDQFEGKFAVVKMDIDEIIPREHERLWEHTVEGLKRDMKAGKSIHPIAVEPGGLIVDGHHRYEAAKQLGIKRVPVITVFIEEEDG